MGSLLSQSISSVCSVEEAAPRGSQNHECFTNDECCTHSSPSSSSSLTASKLVGSPGSSEVTLGQSKGVAWEAWLQKKMKEDMETLKMKRAERRKTMLENRGKEEERKAEMERSIQHREE